MPQGGIDKGEDEEAAARRELWEETGVTSAKLLARSSNWINYDLPAELVGVALKGKYRGQTQKWFAFRFAGKESEFNITHPPDGAPVEFDAWEWVDYDDVLNRIVAFKAQVYRQVLDEFRDIASAH